jgi:hypothetical protein
VWRAAGLGAVALLAVPLVAQAANRVQFSESFNNGLAAARPAITLHATIDDGNGGAPTATGVMRFYVDRKHLTSSAWASYMAAPAGTQLATFSSEITGTSSVRVLSHGDDANGQYVRAGIDVPGAVASAIGDDNLVLVVRRTSSHAHVAYVLDLRPVIAKLGARGAPTTLQQVTLALRSSIHYGGRSRGITINPSSLTAMTNSASASACAQPTCTSVLASTSGRATVHLPKAVTLAAPVAATYGYRYSIGGTGRSGDAVSLQGQGAAGVPPRGSTMVRPDGTFVIRATLRSIFSDDGDLAMAARGRYVVAATEGGNATVYGTAGQDTHVVLARPRFVLTRKAGGHLLHFSVRIPGADEHVRVAIKLGARTLATGYATRAGTFSKTIVKPHDRGNLRVVAAVPGADTAISDATPLSR